MKSTVPLLIAVALVATACASTPPSGSSAEPTPSATASNSTEPTVAPTVASPTATPSPTPRWPAGTFHADLAMEVVSHLADVIGPRPAGSDGDEQTRAYLADVFRDAGWTVQVETVALPQGGFTENVIAALPGTSLDERHTVVGGHHDTVAGTPGANDNATGIGALVALAYALNAEPHLPETPLVLVAFGAEEYQPTDPREHHLGSADYVARHGPSVTQMLSVDMVGHAHPDVHCICYLRDQDDALAQELLAVAEGSGLGDGFRVEARGDISDHGPFALAGIPAAFLWSYDDGVKHTPADVVEPLHAEDVDRVGRFLLAWLASRPGES